MDPSSDIYKECSSATIIEKHTARFKEFELLFNQLEKTNENDRQAIDQIYEDYLAAFEAPKN